MKSAQKPKSYDEKTIGLVFMALGTALALVLSYVEALVPVSLGVPGARPGLANIVTVTLLYAADWKAALMVSLARIFLSGFLFGNLFAILYSLAGFGLSFLGMLLLRRSGRFGMTGVSVAGGVLHNVGQLGMAALLTDGYVFAYLPMLVAAGTAAGIVVGVISSMIAGRVGRMLKSAGKSAGR